MYVYPALLRFALVDEVDVVRVILSYLPIMLALPSFQVHRIIQNEEWEHVIRHILFAIGFALSATAVKWDSTTSDEFFNLITYLTVGFVSLSWFSVVHVLENRKLVANMKTHQGDVVILPLTLVSISTFVNTISDDAFQFSRSIVFYIPVMVGWATIFFIAYNSFASRRVTMRTSCTR